MIKIIRVLTAVIVLLEISLANALNQTTAHSPSENATIITPNNHRNSSELLDIEDFKVNSSFAVADKRFFPIGSSDDLLPSTSNLISPFDVSTFGKQLLPLINVNIKEKVKDFARTFNTGADYIEDAIRESWRESPLNPHNFKNLLETPNLFKHLPFPPSPPMNSLRKPGHMTKAQQKHKEKAPKAIESYSVDGMLHDYGINGYKHFEDSILRELEKQEERKVEATIHTLFEQGDRIELIKGKPYDHKSGWKPVAAPTKNYEDNSNINSQIISPLHTSIFNSPQLSSVAPHGFHDFDNLNGNSIHSTYSVHEEEGESKVKPVKAKIASIRKVTPSPPPSVFTRSTATEKSRYRKRHNNNALKTVGQQSVVVSDSGTSGSHDAPKQVVKAKRNPQRHHIQSLTTAKPKSQLRHSGSASSEESQKPDTSVETFGKPAFTYSEPPSRLRSSTSTTSTTTTTTIKPSRNFARETSKYVDKPKATGYRGSIKFGQTTTKQPI